MLNSIPIKTFVKTFNSRILLEGIFGVCLVTVSYTDSIFFTPSFDYADLVIAMVCEASKGLEWKVGGSTPLVSTIPWYCIISFWYYWFFLKYNFILWYRFCGTGISITNSLTKHSSRVQGEYLNKSNNINYKLIILKIRPTKYLL